MLYTRKGDGGTTKTLHCDLPDGKAGQRLSKSSAVAEALGTVDELNSWLGYCRTQCQGSTLPEWHELLLGIQQNLFTIQAELAGAPGKTIAEEKVIALEKIIDGIEKELPPIKSFFIPGATTGGALLDYARAVARRAERRVVAASIAATPSEVEGAVKLGKFSLTYLNRLSSFLYALARLVNHRSGIKEQAPDYK